MTKEQTLKDYIELNGLNPECGGMGLEFYNPESSFFKKSQYDGSCTFSIFECKETGIKCGLLETSSHSVLYGENEVESHFGENGPSDDQDFMSLYFVGCIKKIDSLCKYLKLMEKDPRPTWELLEVEGVSYDFELIIQLLEELKHNLKVDYTAEYKQ
jgi:hypothetical protein